MSTQRDSVRQRVKELLASGFFQPPSGAAGAPVAVHNPDGTFQSWMVPFLDGTKLTAWAQLSASLEPMRFSVLGGGKTFPEAGDWLDPRRVAEKVAEVSASRALSAPILTYDRDPSRPAWMVETRDARGAVRRWFVAGDSVWEDRGDEEVTGGPPRS